MAAGLDTLATALYVRTDDLLKTCPQYAPWRPFVGISPELSDAELVTPAVLQAPVHPAHQLTHQVSVKKAGFCGPAVFSNDSDFGRFPGLRWSNPLS